MGLDEDYSDKIIWPAAPGVIFIAFSVIVATFGNINIVIATIRKGQNRKAVHILIGFTAFSDILHQFSHIIFAFNFFRIRIFSSLGDCFYLQVISIYGMNFGSFAYFSVGFDRLICVIAPITYTKLHYSSYYILGLLFMPIAYSSTFLVLCINYIKGAEHKRVLCFITTPLWGQLGFIWNLAQWTTFTLTVCCYGLVWVLLRKKKQIINPKLTTSLTLIVMNIIFGWFITTVINITAEKLGATEYGMFLVHTDLGWPANVAIACNFFIYYVTYPGYRTAFKEQLLLLKFKRVSSTKGTLVMKRTTVFLNHQALSSL